jgi:Tfp pilus assembly protein PilO
MRFLFPLSFIIISIILFFVIVDPLYKDVSKLKGDVVIYNTALDNSTDLQKTRDTLVDTYRNIKQKDKERLEHFLPNTVNNIKFILEIEQIANLHGMPIRNIKFEPEKLLDPKANAMVNTANTTGPNNQLDLRPYGVFPIEFSTEGTYDKFTQFMKDVEHNLRLVDVKSVGFSVPPPPAKPGEGGDPNVYTYTLKVETYWLK